MSADQARRTLNSLETELATLEMKCSGLEKKEADRTKKINDVQRSITKNTSASMLSSKSKQIQGYQSDIAKIAADKADMTKKIADKRKKRANAVVRLQHEEAVEHKKEAKTQKAIQQNYERRIAELSKQLILQVLSPVPDDASAEETAESFDVFVSHAWEDKEAFVDEFVSELVALGIEVWYDKEKIAMLFPAAVSEDKVNFDLLRTTLGDEAHDDEAYEFTWVGKKEAVRESGRPVRKTLSPCVEESKDWDTTENLYTEGDNLDVLKLLQESFLGKVKMMYIDPPYNTGNDFMYRDNFVQSREEYEDEAGACEEDGGKRKPIMVQLPEVCSNGTEAAKSGYTNICGIGRIRRTVFRNSSFADIPSKINVEEICKLLAPNTIMRVI